MQLFDSEMINISRIYTVEKYEPEDGKQRITEYDTFFRTYEIVFYLYGETETLVDDVKIHDAKNAIRYMPKGQRSKIRIESICFDRELTSGKK